MLCGVCKKKTDPTIGYCVRCGKPHTPASGSGENGIMLVVPQAVSRQQILSSSAIRLIDQHLGSIGESLDETRVTAIVKDHTLFLPPRLGDIEAGVDPWIKSLEAEIEEFKPRVIVAMGETTMRALTGHRDIWKRRGSVYPSQVGGWKTIPTHEALTVFQGNARLQTYLFYDLRRAVRESQREGIHYPERRLLVGESPEFYIEWLRSKRVQESPEICLDIECDGSLQMNCIGFAIDPMEAISIPLSKMRVVEEAEVLGIISQLLRREDIRKIGQNVIFDANFLSLQNAMDIRGPFEDTLVMQSIFRPNLEKGLDVLCSLYTDEPYYKDEGKIWKEVRDFETFWRYNAKDAATTLEIYQRLKPMLENGGYWPQYRATMDLYEPLLYMMWRGMKTNPKGMLEVKKDLEPRIWESQEKLNQLVAKELERRGQEVDPTLVDPMTRQMGLLNIDSPDQVKKYFYQTLKIPAYKNQGKATTDRKALEKLALGTAARPGRPEASEILKLRDLKKSRGFFYVKLTEDARFKTFYNPRGTKTGRLSSNKSILGYGYNSQNLPLRFKEFFVPDKDYLLFEVDKAGAEWVVVAYVTGDPKMIEVVESGRSPHTATAHFMTGIPDKWIELEDEYVGHAVDREHVKRERERLFSDYHEAKEAFRNANFVPEILTCRQAGKKSNHGFNYDLRENQFSIQNDIPIAEGRMLYQGYHGAYPGIHRWHAWVREEIARSRVLYNCHGYKMYFEGKKDLNLHRLGYAFNPQSTIVWILNHAMVEIWNHPWPEMQKVEMLFQVHDSLVLQYPKSEGPQNATKALKEIERILNPTLRWQDQEFVVKTTASTGSTWAGAKSLDITSAETTFNGIKPFYQ